MTASSSKAGIIDLARTLGAGQYGALLCPACSGGEHKEKSLSLSIDPSGIVKYYCHRASCAFQGQAYAHPGQLGSQPQQMRPSNVNPLKDDIYPLSDSEAAWFVRRFNLTQTGAKEHIYRTMDRYVLPIYRPDGTKRGHITRRPWDGSPADTKINRNSDTWQYKALTYMDLDESVMSWYRKTSPGIEKYPQGTFIVEDQISAMRLYTWLCAKNPEYVFHVAALLGTGMNAGKVAEIQRLSDGCTVRIALDADATGHAFAVARKWGQAFASCRVIVLTKDIKDMTDDELNELPTM